MMESRKDEDCMEYFIYPNEPIDDTLHHRIFAELTPLFKDYVWHKDPFNLNFEGDHFYGRLYYGDNVQDEWFVVSLLAELTRKFPGYVVRVIDADGEFPLIEAANVLPKWAQNPELTEKRVYFYMGKLHLIPIAQTPAELTPLASSSSFEVIHAVNVVRTFPSITEASHTVQTSIQNRLGGFPNNLAEMFHFAHVSLPRKLALILKHHPELISPAIHCFYSRDHLDNKVLRTMKHFPYEDPIMTRVKFTKCLYAMMDSSKFVPDKRSKWPISNSRPSVLGAKVTAGFEILASQIIINDDDDDDSTVNDVDPVFKKFVSALESSGYFQGLLPGSQNYSALMEKAKSFFRMNSMNGNGVKFSRDLRDAMNESYDHDVNDEILEPEDDESWMELDRNAFDRLLETQFGLRETELEQKEDEIPGKIKTFLEKMSGIDGVETERTNHEDVDDDDEIRFDPDKFEDCVKRLLRIDDDNDDDDDDDDDDEDELEGNIDVDDQDMKDYFEALSSELSGTKADPVNRDEEWERPLDVNPVVLKNLMESYKSQDGVAGPMSTLLKSFQLT